MGYSLLTSNQFPEHTGHGDTQVLGVVLILISITSVIALMIF